MKVRDLWSGRVVTAMREYSLREAARIMWDNGVDSLLVIEGGRLRGIITAGDMVQRIASDADPDCDTIGSCMTPDPAVVAADAELPEAIERMLELHVHHLPVVDVERVVSMLSAADLLRAGREPAAATGER